MEKKMEAKEVTTHATSTHEATQLSKTPLPTAAHRQKGVYAFVYAMESVMKSMTSANKGYAAMLNAKTSEANRVAKQYGQTEEVDNLQEVQSENGLQSKLLFLEVLQVRANKTQQNMGTYATDIENTEQGELTAALNGKAVVDTYGKIGQTR